jgi:hypothetical protein
MVAATLAATACAPAVEGDWESQEPIDEQRNRLTVEGEPDATATVWIFRTVNGQQTAQSFEFKAQWQEKRAGESFQFDMRCDVSPYGDCDVEDDFQMDCNLEGDEDQLVCEVDDNPRWAQYGFAWRKLE